MSFYLYVFLAAIVAWGASAAYSSIVYRKKIPAGAKTLPGPWGLPIVGRVHDFPKDNSWFKTDEWGKKYGPIYQSSMMGVTHVWITKQSIADDLLAKRGQVYSDRPGVPSLDDSKSTYGNGEYLPLMGRNVYWARQRKFNHGIIVDTKQVEYQDQPSLEAKRMLVNMLKHPEEYTKNLEDMTAKVMSRMTWGTHYYSDKLKDSAWGLLVQMSPAGPLTNRLTPLLLLPAWLSPWASYEKDRHDVQAEWFLNTMEEIKAKIKAGDQDPSWMRRFLENQDKLGWSDYEGAFAIGMLAVAGVFTVGSPLHTFLVAVVHHPQWLKSIQHELDTVCGEKFPELSDFPRLPILRAVIMECLRWRPAVPTGVAHQLEEDDVYDGYHIPKGSIVHPNEWSFSRDEELYPDAANFRPERWINPEWPTYKEPLTKYPTIANYSLFGFGRRTCLGQSLTEAELWMGCGGLAWGFDIRKKLDDQGKEISVPWNKYNSLLIIRPDPFTFDIKPRSEKRVEQIMANWKEASANDPLDSSRGPKPKYA